MLAIAFTGAACIVLVPFKHILGGGQVALVFVLAVWATAAIAGVWPGLLAAVAAFSAMIYLFLPPYYQFAVHRPSDWLTLAVFVLVAGIEGLQTGRLRDRENRAVQGEREAEALAGLTAQLVTHSSATVVGQIVTREVSRATGSKRVAVLVPEEDGGLACLAAADGFNVLSDAGIERFSRWVIDNGTAVGVPPLTDGAVGDDRSQVAWPESVAHEAVVPGAQRSDIFLPLTTPTHIEGVLYIGPRPGRHTLDSRDVRLAVSLARLLGAFLERHRLETLASEAETLKEAEKLKSTLISSVSHELKTPLAAMTATVSGLIAPDAERDAEQMRRDLEVVDEGLKRLSASIADLLDLSRLESDSWEPRRESYDVGEIVGSLLGRMSDEDQRRTTLAIPSGLPPIEVDFVQWSRALSNLIENALAYSDPRGAVLIGARQNGGAVETWVEDDGPGIPEDERARVFEKFYRGSAAERVPSGTGLGLTIAQEIVRFNGGTIEVESVRPHGTRFVVSVPAAPRLPSENGE